MTVARLVTITPHLEEAREVTREQHARGDACAMGVAVRFARHKWRARLKDKATLGNEPRESRTIIHMQILQVDLYIFPLEIS